MRNVILFIAMSLDGFIADQAGKVDWIGGHGNDHEMLDVYSEFVTHIDTVIMGWNTYYQVVTELSPQKWVYEGLTSYVITHKDCPSTDSIQFTDNNPCNLIKELKEKDGKDIWICGGATIIQQLMAENLIDIYYISVIPLLLGTGIRLFSDCNKTIPLRLWKTQTYDGITDLIYKRREMIISE